MLKVRNWISLCAMVALVAGCGDEESADVDVRFSAQVGSTAFECGQTYDGLGTGDQELTIKELRFYIHNLRLVDSDGNESPVTLDAAEIHQTDSIALVDLADGDLSGCEGDAATFSSVTGRVDSGDYVALRFTLGLPFEDNHQDVGVAEAPLNLSDMFWTWQGGYKFMRIDGASQGLPAWRFHLGSTGCDGDPATGGVTMCSNENRAQFEVAIDGVDDIGVVLDVAALLEDVDLDQQQMSTPEGCMSGPGDMDCTPYFNNLGLDHGGSNGAENNVFVGE